MSSGSQDTRADLREALARELRQFNGLGASFFRAAAAHANMTVTDLQVLDMLDSIGPMTAGQLADLTGLTTGAITGMLNRLEEAGLVLRERDPDDGRRVIVRLAPGADATRPVNPIVESIARAWDELASHYDDEQLAFLVEFLGRGNALSRREIARLREAPEGAEGIVSAPLGNLESARLVVSSGITRLALRADAAMAELYRARFEGPIPDVKAKDGVVTIRYPRRHLWPLDRNRIAEIALNVAVPWEIAIQGGISEVAAQLGGLDLAGLEVKGGMGSLAVDLPLPSRIVPVRVSGGASMITIRRPAGVAARAHLKGWATEFIFDENTFSNLGNDVRLQSQSFDATAPGYDIEVASSVSMVTITTA